MNFLYNEIMKYLLIIFSLLLTSVSRCDETQFNNISLHNLIDNMPTKKEEMKDFKKQC